MKTYFLAATFIISFLAIPFTNVTAAEFAIRPFLIDKTLPPAAIDQETILLTNDSTYRKYVVYATVNEISVDTTGEIKEFVTPSVSDRTNTVTSWIELGRGRIEIPPGEKKEVPLTLRVNSNAVPGEYHVFLGFVPAPNRPQAEEIAMRGEADGVVLKITVSDDRKDSMKINEFSIDRFVVSESDRAIEITVQNLGDLSSAPVGEIIFYNSRGQEVAAVKVNEDEAITVEPNESTVLKAYVPIETGLGRYKANLALRYGINQPGAIYDSATFYMLSPHLLLVLFGGILVVVLLLTLLLRKVLGANEFSDEGDEVVMFVKDGHEANPQEHDIDLKTKNK